MKASEDSMTNSVGLNWCLDVPYIETRYKTSSNLSQETVLKI